MVVGPAGEERFSHLLQPIRDIAANWNIDVACELEEYLVRSDCQLISPCQVVGLRWFVPCLFLLVFLWLVHEPDLVGRYCMDNHMLIMIIFCPLLCRTND